MTQEKAMNMSNEQAIKLLQSMMLMMCDQHGCPVSDVYFALEKAVEALTGQQWTLCSEGLPKEDDTEVIVSCTDDSGDSEFSYTTIGWHYKGIWVVGNERSCFVRAWMPLPEPYKETGNDQQ